MTKRLQPNKIDALSTLRLRASWGTYRVDLDAMGTPALVAIAIALALWLR